MQEYPITTSILHKGLGSLLLLLAIAIQCALLTLYGDLPLSITLVDSLLSIALFAVAGYYLWYVQCTLHIMQARVARRTRTNRLHSRMLDLATNIRIGRLGGILDHDSCSIPVRPNGMDHSIPMVCQSGKKE